jgi:BirA family biotin operon repressor/biotin-[acetyl-CoA-carboxylase] ligase
MMDSTERQTPSALTFTLLRRLADGEFHSGEVLAQQLGISRASVSNALRGVENLGLELYSVRGRGYRLCHPPQWLDAARVGGYLAELSGRFQIEIADSAVSSNTLLLRRAAQGAPGGSVLALEWQSGGRGRLGRTWHSALGGGLTFSLLWRFDCGLSALSGLSLAAGVALIRALRALGVTGAQLKWPNDVVAAGGKLAGILTEAQGDMLGPCAVVIGIGLNLALPKALMRQIGQPVTCMAELMGAPPERNLLLAALLRELDGVLHTFAAHGFAALREEWESYHAMQNQPVQLSLPDGGLVNGTALGVDESGALVVETAGGAKRFNVGEISLRGARHVAV